MIGEKNLSITPALISIALSYDQYVAFSAELLAQGSTTSESPAYNSPEMLGYAKLNLHRMSRLDRLTVLQDELKAAAKAVPEPWIWLVLTESWCGDAAQSVPVLHHIAKASDNIEIRFLFRDKNPDVINEYLTNGGKSIPKLICLRASDLVELGTWGPRPTVLQNLFMEWRSAKRPSAEISEALQRWYNSDRTESIQRDMLALITTWSKYTPLSQNG